MLITKLIFKKYLLILRIFKATNSSQRHYIGLKYDLSSKIPIIKLKFKQKIKNGNGGHKKRYRLLRNNYLRR